MKNNKVHIIVRHWDDTESEYTVPEEGVWSRAESGLMIKPTRGRPARIHVPWSSVKDYMVLPCQHDHKPDSEPQPAATFADAAVTSIIQHLQGLGLSGRVVTGEQFEDVLRQSQRQYQEDVKASAGRHVRSEPLPRFWVRSVPTGYRVVDDWTNMNTEPFPDRNTAEQYAGYMEQWAANAKNRLAARGPYSAYRSYEEGYSIWDNIRNRPHTEFIGHSLFEKAARDLAQDLNEEASADLEEAAKEQPELRTDAEVSRDEQHHEHREHLHSLGRTVKTDAVVPGPEGEEHEPPEVTAKWELEQDLARLREEMSEASGDEYVELAEAAERVKEEIAELPDDPAIRLNVHVRGLEARDGSSSEVGKDARVQRDVSRD